MRVHRAGLGAPRAVPDMTVAGHEHVGDLLDRPQGREATHTSVTTPAMMSCLRPVALVAVPKSLLSRGLFAAGLSFVAPGVAVPARPGARRG